MVLCMLTANLQEEDGALPEKLVVWVAYTWEQPMAAQESQGLSYRVDLRFLVAVVTLFNALREQSKKAGDVELVKVMEVVEPVVVDIMVEEAVGLYGPIVAVAVAVVPLG